MKEFNIKLYSGFKSKKLVVFAYFLDFIVYSIILSLFTLFLPTYNIGKFYILFNIAIACFLSILILLYNILKPKKLIMLSDCIVVKDFRLFNRKIKYCDIDYIDRGISFQRCSTINEENSFTIHMKYIGISSLFGSINYPIYICDEYDTLFNMIKEQNNNIKFPCGTVYLGETVTVTIDRPLGSYHPEHKELYYPINYGYIEGVFANDGEEQDAYVIGIDKPVVNYTGKVIAIIKRLNDNEDKWVVSPNGADYTKDQITDFVHFQEQYFDTEIVMYENKA